MKRKSHVLVLVVAALMLGCAEVPHAKARQHAPDRAEMHAGGVSFVYSTKDFAAVTIEQVKKNVVMGDGVADGESPAHYCVHLKDQRSLPALAQGPRFFFPANSFICAFPLQDSTVKDFRTAYYPLHSAAEDLHTLLRDHPTDLEHWSATTKIDIPDFPDVDAGNSIVSKFRYLDFQSGSGVVFLTQYSNENLPNPVNNEELTLDFQGLTNDGRFYVAARLAVMNPALPRGIDFTDSITRDPYWHYLKKEQQELDGLPEASFRPSLGDLTAMLASLRIE